MTLFTTTIASYSLGDFLLLSALTVFATSVLGAPLLGDEPGSSAPSLNGFLVVNVEIVLPVRKEERKRLVAD